MNSEIKYRGSNFNCTELENKYFATKYQIFNELTLQLKDQRRRILFRYLSYYRAYTLRRNDNCMEVSFDLH